MHLKLAAAFATIAAIQLYIAGSARVDDVGLILEVISIAALFVLIAVTLLSKARSGSNAGQITSIACLMALSSLFVGRNWGFAGVVASAIVCCAASLLLFLRTSKR